MLETKVLERIATIARERGLERAWSDDHEVLTISDPTTASYHRTLRVQSPPRSAELWFELGLGIRMLQVMEDKEDGDLALRLAQDIFDGAVREVVVVPPSGPPVTTEWFVGREDSPVSHSMSGPASTHYEGSTVVIRHGPWPSRQHPKDPAGFPGQPT
jgi:hypothetical protein